MDENFGGGKWDRANQVKARHSEALFQLGDVVGHGIGRNAEGEPVIEVYLANDNAETHRRVPAALENVPVRVIVTGPFVAY
jgi:hypothetical protein